MRAKKSLPILLTALLLTGIAVGLTLAQNDDEVRSSAPPSSSAEDTRTESWAFPEETEPVTAIQDWRITGTALRPRSPDVDYMPTGDGGCMYASAGNSSRTFNAPVFLPQGTTVKAMRMYHSDSNDSSDSWAWFTVYNLYGEIAGEWVVSSGKSRSRF